MSEPLAVFPIPEFWGFPPNVQIATGGCVASPPRPWRKTLAHAHTSHKGMGPQGWICFRYAHHVLLRPTPTSEAVEPHLPSDILLHELAHVITDEGHTTNWDRIYQLLSRKFSAMRRPEPKVDKPMPDPVFPEVKKPRRRRSG